MAVRDAAWDLKRLRVAAGEFFNEGFVYPEASRILAQTAPENLAAARKALLPQRSLPEGYYIWITYLIWIERVLEIVPLDLTAVEVEGLMVLKQERNHFKAEHPDCPHCGMPNEAHALRCRECMHEISR
jgi:hypothetical protein